MTCHYPSDTCQCYVYLTDTSSTLTEEIDRGTNLSDFSGYLPIYSKSHSSIGVVLKDKNKNLFTM